MISRSYPLSLLLVVVACVFLRERWRRPVRLGVALFPLSHTSVHGSILALTLMFGLVLDFLLRGRFLIGGSPAGLCRILVAFFIALFGFFLSAAQLLPAPDTGFANFAAGVIPGLYFDGARFADSLRLLATVFFFPLGRDLPWMPDAPRAYSPVAVSWTPSRRPAFFSP